MPNLDGSVRQLNQDVYNALGKVQNPRQMNVTEAKAVREAVLKDGKVDDAESDLLAELRTTDHNRTEVRVTQKAEFAPNSLTLGPVSGEAAEQLDIGRLDVLKAKASILVDDASTWTRENVSQPLQENVIKPAAEWTDRNVVQPINEHVVQPVVQMFSHIWQYDPAQGTPSERQANCGPASAHIVGTNLGLDMPNLQDIRRNVGARTGNGQGAFAISTGQLVDAVENQATEEGRRIEGDETRLNTNVDQVLNQMRERLAAGEQVVLLTSNLAIQQPTTLRSNSGSGHYVVVNEVKPDGSIVISDPQRQNGSQMTYSRQQLATHLQRRERFGRENMMVSFRDLDASSAVAAQPTPNNTGTVVS